MSTPTRTETLNTFFVSTAANRRPGLIDNFFDSSPVWARIRGRESVRLSGGETIREHFVYASFSGGSYGRGDEFNTETKEFATDMVFNWKFSYMPANIDVIDMELNSGAERIFDIMNATLDNAELSLIDDLSTQLFGDGSGNASKDLDGFGIAISTSGTYGGITRSGSLGDGTPQAQVIAGFEDSTGGALSLSSVNDQFGNAVLGKEKPDLMATTQALWNDFWARVQPSDRNPTDRAADMRNVGFEVVRFNGADVTVDSHVPSGTIYFLNTRWLVLYVHRNWDFQLRSPGEPTNQQRIINQLMFWGNLVCKSPRLQGVMDSLS